MNHKLRLKGSNDPHLVVSTVKLTYCELSIINFAMYFVNLSVLRKNLEGPTCAKPLTGAMPGWGLKAGSCRPSSRMSPTWKRSKMRTCHISKGDWKGCWWPAHQSSDVHLDPEMNIPMNLWTVPVHPVHPAHLVATDLAIEAEADRDVGGGPVVRAGAAEVRAKVLGKLSLRQHLPINGHLRVKRKLRRKVQNHHPPHQALEKKNNLVSPLLILYKFYTFKITNIRPVSMLSDTYDWCWHYWPVCLTLSCHVLLTLSEIMSAAYRQTWCTFWNISQPVNRAAAHNQRTVQSRCCVQFVRTIIWRKHRLRYKKKYVIAS